MNVIIKEIAINVCTKDELMFGKETATLNAIQSNLYEAIIHALVKKMFQTIGLDSIIPTLYEISSRIYEYAYKNIVKIPSDIKSINMVMEYVHGYTFYDYCKVQMTKIHNAAFHDHMPLPILNARIRNEKLFIDVLVQLCCYLDVLQTNLRFNHRDLNINNILVRKNKKSRLFSTIRNIIHPALLTNYECKTDIVIIDFGFSCLACEKSNKSCLEAGSYFNHNDDCLKKGRDICLFLYSFNAIFPFIHHFSSNFCNFLQSLLIAIDNKENKYNLLNGISSRKDGFERRNSRETKENIIVHTKSEIYSTIEDEKILKESDKLSFNEDIYIFLKREEIEVPFCEPTKVLELLQKYGYVL
jgi:serine/threonine protein kinase